MKNITKQRSLLMASLIKSNWKLSIVGSELETGKLWANLEGGKFAIRLRKKNFTLYKRIDNDLVEVETLKYNRRQSQQIKRLIAKHR